MTVPSLKARWRTCTNSTCFHIDPSSPTVRRIESRANCLVLWKQRNNLKPTNQELHNQRVALDGHKPRKVTSR